MEWTKHHPYHIPSSWPGGPSIFRPELQPWVGCLPFSLLHPQLGSAPGFHGLHGARDPDTCCLSLLHSPEPSVRLSCVPPPSGLSPGHSLGSPTDAVRRGQPYSNCGPCRDLPDGSRSRKRQRHSALGSSDRGLREAGVELDMKGQKQLGSAVAAASALVQLEPGVTSDGASASVPGHLWEDTAASPLPCNHPPAGGRAMDSRADPVPRSTSPHPLGCQLPLEPSPGRPAELSGTSGHPASEN